MQEDDRLVCQSRELRVDVRDDFGDTALQLILLRGLQRDLNENDLRRESALLTLADGAMYALCPGAQGGE